MGLMPLFSEGTLLLLKNEKVNNSADPKFPKM